jgi:hypothetical protein
MPAAQRLRCKVLRTQCLWRNTLWVQYPADTMPLAECPDGLNAFGAMPLAQCPCGLNAFGAMSFGSKSMDAMPLVRMGVLIKVLSRLGSSFSVNAFGQ